MNLNDSNKNDIIDNSIIFPTDITTPTMNPTTSPTIENKSANNTTNNSDFDSIFLSSPTIDTNSKKIDKNSILALYGQGFSSTNNAKPPVMGIPSQPHAPQQHQQQQLPGQTMIKSNSFYSTPMTVNNNHQASFGSASHGQIFNNSFQSQANHFKVNNFIVNFIFVFKFFYSNFC